MPSKRDDRAVALLGAAVLDRLERRLLSRSSSTTFSTIVVVDGLDLGLEREVLVVAELDLGPDLHGRLEDERLALLGLGDLDLGRVSGTISCSRTASRKASSTS